MIQDSTADHPHPNNKFDLPTIARVWYFLNGLLCTINGLVFIGEEFNDLTVACTQSIGNSLCWGNWIGGEPGQGDFQNAAWRSVFSLDPDLFLRNWTGVVIGLITMLCHVPGFRFDFCTHTWIHVALWQIFVVTFGLFAYTGNLGIIFGFFAVPNIILTFILAFTAARNDPTVLRLGFNKFYGSCFVENELFYTITKWLCFLAGIATLIIGLIHVFISRFEWCPGGPGACAPNNQCIGPSLRWSPSSNTCPFIYDINDESGWRSIFTLQLNIVCPLWGPVILGVITIMQHIRGRLWPSIYVSWARVFVWFMFLGLFSGLGYTGNLGIILGFVDFVIALFAFLITVGGGGNTKTHWEFQIRFMDRPRT